MAGSVSLIQAWPGPVNGLTRGVALTEGFNLLIDPY